MKHFRFCAIVLVAIVSGQEQSFATGPPETGAVFIGTTPPTHPPVTEPATQETLRPTISPPPNQAQQEENPCQLCPSGLVVDPTASASVNDVLYPCYSLPSNLGQSPLCEVFRRRVESACCISLMTDGTQTTLEKDKSASNQNAPLWLLTVIEAAFFAIGL